MRAPARLRSRRSIAAERDKAIEAAQSWQRQTTVERQATQAAEAHASHWRRNVAELVGVQAEGRADSDLHRRLQQVVADSGRAQEAADRARDDEEAAYEAVRRVANALRPGCKGFRVDDVVAWAEEAASPDSLLASRETLLRQAEQFEAELTAVDEALAKAGATPADDRVEFLQVLASQHRRGVTVAERVPAVIAQRDAARSQRDQLLNQLDKLLRDARPTPPAGGVGPFEVNCAACGYESGPLATTTDATTLGHEHLAGRHGARPAADGVVDATIACGADVSDVFAGIPGHLPLCALPDGHEGVHVPARDPWCRADLDGVPCARPAGHSEPCSATGGTSGNVFTAPWPAPVLVIARCHASPHDDSVYRCSFVAGHPGVHSWSPELDEVPF